MDDLEYLYGSDYHKYAQQVIFKGPRGGMTWCPGNKSITRERMDEAAANATAIGLTGKQYRRHGAAQYKTPYTLHWMGIDIDDYTDYRRILDLGMPFSVRRSKSGDGLHLILRLNPVLLFPAGQTPGLTVTTALEPYRAKLEAAGVPVCQANHRVFFFWARGGRNEWLHKDPGYTAIKRIDSTIRAAGHPAVPHDSPVVRLLKAKGIEVPDERRSRVQIYVKDLYEALKGTDCEFKTCSPMADGKTPHNNGYLEYEGETDTLRIFTSADNRIVRSWWLGG